MTKAAVGNREVDGRLFETPAEIFLAATGATGAGLLRTMTVFDVTGAGVLAEARFKTPDAG